jgi:hypothetical protein
MKMVKTNAPEACPPLEGAQVAFGERFYTFSSKQNDK